MPYSPVYKRFKILSLLVDWYYWKGESALEWLYMSLNQMFTIFQMIDYQ
jgi:hypothetical protein